MQPKDVLIQEIKDAVGKITEKSVPIQLEHPNQEAYGDYSTNVAMTLLGSLNDEEQGKKWKKPLELAETIKSTLSQSERIGNIVDQIDIVAPGFINFWLSKEVLLAELSQVSDDYGSSSTFAGKTVVVDYSGPNIAKPFGIGHLRSTVVGQAIYNLYEFSGAHVIGDNHLGDWGRQFGVLLYQIISKGLDVGQLTIDKLEELYVEFHKDVEENPDLWDEARGWFKKLEKGDLQAREIWEKVKAISLAEFNKVYKLLDVEIDYAHGESFYSMGDHENLMPEVIEECIEKGIATKDRGALVIHFEDINGEQTLPPAILKKSDGTTNYFTRDLATIKYRLKEWKPDLSIYEVGSEQTLHFQQLFRAVELLDWSSNDHFFHLKHGLYLAPSGKKFSTRKGDTVHLEEVLEEAIERAKTLGKRQERVNGLESKVQDLRSNVSDDNEVARMVGIGAVKYFDLSHHPATNIVFDWEKIMALEGNSAPYIQYTYARTRSLMEKALESGHKTLDKEALTSSVQKLTSEELSLLRTIYKFPEVIEDAARNYSPNLVCNFLFDLSQKYNAFYNRHRIISDDVVPDSDPGTIQTTNLRLMLTSAVGTILKTGLGLLGIDAPEHM